MPDTGRLTPQRLPPDPMHQIRFGVIVPWPSTALHTLLFPMFIQRAIRPSWRSLNSIPAAGYASVLNTTRNIHHNPSPPFLTIPECPSTNCQCAPMPTFPDGLEIDHKKPLAGTMASYAEQLLVCTGQRDWTSRVEDENGGENLVADVKELTGRGGMYADVSPQATKPFFLL